MTSKVLCLLDEESYLCFQRTESGDHHGYMNTFYCNSSIESKKVLININTMPMFKSPLGTTPTPFPSMRKEKKIKNKKKIVAPAVVSIVAWKKRQVFLIYRISTADSFPFFFCIQDVRHWKNNAHTKDTHLHGTFFKTFSCKANQQQHSTLKLRTQVQQGKRGTRSPCPPPFKPPPRIPRGKNTNMSAISDVFQLYYTAANKL